MTVFSSYLSRVALILALNLGVFVVLLLVAMTFARRERSLRWVLLACMLFAVDVAVLVLPRVGVFPTLHRNWQGQILSVSCSLAWIFLARRPTADEAGLVARVPLRALAGALVVGLVVVWSTNGLDVLLNGHRAVAREELWFAATLPGVSEEIFYRGTLLALLDRTFGRPLSIFGARVGWGLPLSSALFISLHFFRVDATSHVLLYTDLHDMTGIGLAALAFGWIRARTGSLWPGIVVHNIANLIH